jgi:NADH dehydrogenase
VVRGDLLDPASVEKACAGVDQIFSTANNVMGTGPSSPRRVDVPAYRNLVAAAAAAGVRRHVHTSAFGIANSGVDFFEIKCQVDQVIQAGATPWVLLRPSAFLDIWVRLAVEQARKGPVMVFGKGTTRSNYVAVDDVARCAVRVLESPEIGHEEINIGGPSTLTQPELFTLIEQTTGLVFRRKPVPRAVLRAGSVLLRRFQELPARLMAMGAWVAAADRLMIDWEKTARRFDYQPMTAGEFLAAQPKEAA